MSACEATVLNATKEKELALPSLTLEQQIAPNSDLHKRIITAVRDRITASKTKYGKRHDEWRKAEEKALAYLPEREIDAARRVEREVSGKPQYTTIQIPYSYAMILSSHTYLTTVFMARDPMLQFSGRHGEGEMQVQAMEALIAYQVQVGQMLVPLYIWMLDAPKYGVGIIGEYWADEFSYVSSIVEEEVLYLGMISTGKMRRKKRTERVPGYSGNRLYNVRPFDFYPDPRVTLANFQKGEFCAVRVELGWNEIVKRKEKGYYTNIDRIRPGRQSSDGYQEREEGSSQLELPSTDTFYFDDFSKDREKRKNSVVEAFECHMELIPKDWGLGKSDYPEKWVFTVDSYFQTVFGAMPLGAIHDKFPFDVLEWEPEGYAIANRGIPEIMKPIQETMDWLINSHFYNVRKVLNDQFVVDPSKIMMSDVLDPLPGGLIRLKPAAYGTDPAQAIKQLQVQDVTQTHLRDIQVMNEIGQRAVGINDQIMGVTQQSGRRTAAEVRTNANFGISRLKTIAEFQSAQGWAPMAQKLVQNSQQYYSGEKKFRIVGDLVQDAGQKFLQVTPDDIAGFFDLVPVDGSLPIDRFAQANLWREFFGQLRNFPQIMQQYDMGKIFAWVAQLAGLKNVNQFKVQVVPDQMAQQEAQAGNVVGLGARSGLKDMNVIPEPGQLSGVGTTG